MPLISKDFIHNRLLPAADIVRILQQYISLKKAGTSYKCCCPFHNEKTPSFIVTPSRNTYKCFGCGEGGNVIDFIMKYKNKSFVEAVEELAALLNMEVEYEAGFAPKKDDRLDAMFDLTRRTASFFAKCLRENDAALSYFKDKRQLSDDLINKAVLGFAPDDMHALERAVVRNGKDSELMKELGLIRDKISERTGKKYTAPLFRNRVMIPIYNVKGHIIAFGGRVIDGSEPKYINSPESRIFKKRKELFGLFECLQANRYRPESVILVEGYLDVLALREAGFNNAVAALGTAATPDHFRLLQKYTKKITVCFDGDNAGRKAAMKAYRSAAAVIENDTEVRFALMPSSYDPDSLVREKGAEMFKHVIETAGGFSEFPSSMCRYNHNIEEPEGRFSYINEVLSIIKCLRSPLRQSMSLQVLAQVTGMSENDLRYNMEHVTPDRETEEVISQAKYENTGYKNQQAEVQHRKDSSTEQTAVNDLSAERLRQQAAEALRRATELELPDLRSDPYRTLVGTNFKREDLNRNIYLLLSVILQYPDVLVSCADRLKPYIFGRLIRALNVPEYRLFESLMQVISRLPVSGLTFGNIKEEFRDKPEERLITALGFIQHRDVSDESNTYELTSKLYKLFTDVLREGVMHRANFIQSLSRNEQTDGDMAEQELLRRLAVYIESMTERSLHNVQRSLDELRQITQKE